RARRDLGGSGRSGDEPAAVWRGVSAVRWPAVRDGSPVWRRRRRDSPTGGPPPAPAGRASTNPAALAWWVPREGPVEAASVVPVATRASDVLGDRGLAR